MSSTARMRLIWFFHPCEESPRKRLKSGNEGAIDSMPFRINDQDSSRVPLGLVLGSLGRRQPSRRLGTRDRIERDEGFPHSAKGRGAAGSFRGERLVRGREPGPRATSGRGPGCARGPVTPGTLTAATG